MLKQFLFYSASISLHYMEVKVKIQCTHSGLNGLAKGAYAVTDIPFDVQKSTNRLFEK